MKIIPKLLNRYVGHRTIYLAAQQGLGYLKNARTMAGVRWRRWGLSPA